MGTLMCGEKYTGANITPTCIGDGRGRARRPVGGFYRTARKGMYLCFARGADSPPNLTESAVDFKDRSQQNGSSVLGYPFFEGAVWQEYSASNIGKMRLFSQLI